MGGLKIFLSLINGSSGKEIFVMILIELISLNIKNYKFYKRQKIRSIKNRII